MARGPAKKQKRERYTVAQVEKALRASAGIIAVTATKLKCSRSTVGNYLKRHPELESVMAEISDETLDLCEAKMLEKIQAGDNTMIIFYLKTKGKERGYSERIETTGKNGGAITVEKIDCRELVVGRINSIRERISSAEGSSQSH